MRDRRIVFDLKPTSWSGGIFARRDALLRVPNMEMTRHRQNGDARKRIPPSQGWPRVRNVDPSLKRGCEVLRQQRT